MLIKAKMLMGAISRRKDMGRDREMGRREMLTTRRLAFPDARPAVEPAGQDILMRHFGPATTAATRQFGHFGRRRG